MGWHSIHQSGAFVQLYLVTTRSRPFSIADLETRRGLRKGDLSTLAKAWGTFCPDGRATGDWEQLRGFVANGAGAGAAVAGVTGKKATDGKHRKDPRPDKLLFEAARTLALRMEKLPEVEWGKNTEGRDYKPMFHTWLASLFMCFPQEAREQAADWICHEWPDGEAAALGKRLAARIKEGGK